MSTFTTWKIEPHPDGWVVRRHDRAGCESRHDEKGAAIRTAKLLATEDPPSQILVHDAEGSIIDALHFNDTGPGPAPVEETLTGSRDLHGPRPGVPTPAGAGEG